MSGISGISAGINCNICEVKLDTIKYYALLTNNYDPICINCWEKINPDDKKTPGVLVAVVLDNAAYQEWCEMAIINGLEPAGLMAAMVNNSIVYKRMFESHLKDNGVVINTRGDA